MMASAETMPAILAVGNGDCSYVAINTNWYNHTPQIAIIAGASIAKTCCLALDAPRAICI